MIFKYLFFIHFSMKNHLFQNYNSIIKNSQGSKRESRDKRRGRPYLADRIKDRICFFFNLFLKVKKFIGRARIREFCSR